MRDLFVTLMVFGCLPFILRNAWVGVLVWSWLGYMNPHRLTYGFAYSMPFAQIVAVTLLVALVLNREKKSFPVNGITVVWILYLLWMCITTANAMFPDHAFQLLSKVLKIQLITFLTLLLINSRERIEKLVWVIIFSIGYFSTKGGVFTLLTGGSFRVYGPPGTYIEENNALAVATLMIIPMMYFCYRQAANKWIKRGLLFAMFFSFLSALGSQSRGALLAIIAVSAYFWWGSKHKFAFGLVGVVLGLVTIGFMSDSWHERMGTIATYQEDASAMGRINAWQYSINIASDRLTGGGFHSWKPQTFAMYAPNPHAVHAAHSIFFGPLGDHGWLGLIMFASILIMSWRALGKVAKESEESWSVDLAKMLKVSMVAYVSGGAFLSLAYFDLPWHIIALSVVLLVLHQSKAPARTGKTQRTNHFGNPGM